MVSTCHLAVDGFGHAKLAAKIGRTVEVIVDSVDPEGGATGRSKADAPEIDGSVFLRNVPATLTAGDSVFVPAGVGVVQYLSVIGASAVPLVVGLVVSWFAALAKVSATMRRC